MTDRRNPMFPSNVYPSGQWSGWNETNHIYQSPSGQYPPSSYNTSSGDHNQNPGSSHQRSPSYTADAEGGASIPYANAYYAANSQYSSVGPPPVSSPPPPPAYSLINSAIPTAQSSRQPHTHSHSNSHLQSSHSHVQSSHSHSHPRPRSHSQTHPYLSPQVSAHSAVLTTHQLQGSQYPPFSQTISIPAQYPPSPSRPFSSNMCALSFNRSHDLSRHRQTHTGEKPFLCNGGCGKSFTRFAQLLMFTTFTKDLTETDGTHLRGIRSVLKRPIPSFLTHGTIAGQAMW